CNIVFAPDVATMYPEPDTRRFDFGSLETVMEGAFRPGHFNGVAQIVSKLFMIVEPDKAFFGQKDFQQFAIIKAMTKQLELPIEVSSCPIIREKSGLSMSSRNQRLNAEQLEAASNIYKSLLWAKDNVATLSPAELKEATTKQINENTILKVEYVEISDADTLQPVQTWEESNNIVMCVAVFCGDVRLIDNIILL
ncbi:MAG: 4-phosphopantoate--beta-alanine ligase, partial [Draconibacterium sp.]